MNKEQIESMKLVFYLIGYNFDQNDSRNDRLIFRKKMVRTVIVEDWNSFEEWISSYEFENKRQAERVEFILHPEQFVKTVSDSFCSMKEI